MRYSSLVLALLATSACSSDPAGGAGAPAETRGRGAPGPFGGAGSPGTPGSGGAPDSAAPGDGTGSGGTASVKAGQITLSQSALEAGGTLYYSVYASAYWYAVAGAQQAGSSCARSTVASCSVTECDLRNGQLADGGVTKTPPNAGRVTVSGGLLPAAGLILTPTGPSGAYSAATLQTRAFQPGDVLVAQAVGAEVGSFADKAVTAPPDIRVTAPTFDASQRTSVDRARDLAVTWTNAAGALGGVAIALTTTRQGARSVTVQCSADAAAGRAVVAAAALQRLDAADGADVFGSISISAFAETSFKAGEFDTTFRVVGGGKTGTFTAAQ